MIRRDLGGSKRGSTEVSAEKTGKSPVRYR
jgi:hypothetical protein